MVISPNIFIVKDAAECLESFLNQREYTRIIALTDENTYQHCLPAFRNLIPEKNVIQIQSGEENKTISTCEKIWQAMTDLRLDRKSLMLNIGGGVIGDMGGFCAATYKRGIDFVQMPTTLLSQVDASVGGKLGIDFKSFKNHIGVFRVPDAVIIDTGFLTTLPSEEFRSGFAEIIKHCLIADKSKWEEIRTKKLDQQDIEDLVAHSVAVKAKVAEVDPLEKGLRKILNFGHTIGHAIESYFLNIPDKKLLHGEAIAIGMICESYISMKRHFISQEELNKIRDYIISIYGKIEIFEYDVEQILPLTLQDKKNEKDEILCTLLEETGKANYNNPITFKEIRESIRFYNI
ncbi:MAG: 3-dehydroquinate synthase [Cytophagaceae bacterium]